MRTEITFEQVSVGRGELRVLEAFAGRVLTCRQGRVWLTEEGFAQDVVLETGDCYRVRSGGKLLLEAADEAVLGVRLERGCGADGRLGLEAA